MFVIDPKWDPRWLDEQGHDEIVDSMRFDPGFPDRILDRLDDGDLSRVEAASIVPAMWGAVHFPMLYLTMDEWLELWDHARPHLPRPASALRLYRGAEPGNERSLAWSASYGVAAAAISETMGRGSDARVWVAEVPASAIICDMDAALRDRNLASTMDEFIVDPRATWELSDRLGEIRLDELMDEYASPFELRPTVRSAAAGLFGFTF